MKIINNTIFKSKMAIKAFGLLINGVNQDGPRTNLFRSAQTSL